MVKLPVFRTPTDGLTRLNYGKISPRKSPESWAESRIQ